MFKTEKKTQNLNHCNAIKQRDSDSHNHLEELDLPWLHREKMREKDIKRREDVLTSSQLLRDIMLNI